MKRFKSTLLTVKVLTLICIFNFIQPVECYSQAQWTPGQIHDATYLFADPIYTQVGIGLDYAQISAQLHIKTDDKIPVPPFVIQTGEKKFFEVGANGNLGIGYERIMPVTKAQLHIIRIPDTKAFPFLIETGEKSFLVGTSGNVGIGYMGSISFEPNASLTIRNEHATNPLFMQTGDGMVSETNSFIVNSNYNVGIGLINPQTKLHVVGETTITSLANQNGNYVVGSDNRGKLILVDKATLGDNLGNHIATKNLMMNGKWINYNSPTTNAGIFINSVNNVGIGNNDPKQPLHVNGNILLTGLNSTILFADDPPTNGNWGKWGIEYETGGLNFWKPYEGKAEGDNYNPKAGTQNYVLFLKDDGNVGIGKSDPTKTLDVNGAVQVTEGLYGSIISPKLSLFGSSDVNSAKIELGNGGLANNRSLKFITSGTTADIQNWVNGKCSMTVRSNEVVLGKAALSDTINLKVNGIVYANEVKVTLTRWNDQVFDKAYQLLPLKDLNNYLSIYKHLPEIPSEKEVVENGVNVGEMNALLLKKIEELTLYIIGLEKKFQTLEDKVSAIPGN
jgi:hypothetical protein